MIIRPPSLFGALIEKWVWILNYSCLVATFVYGIFSTVSLSSSLPKISTGVSQAREPFDTDLIGQGPLFLNGARSALPVENLESELVYIGLKTRPQGKKGLQALKMSLRGSGQEKIVLNKKRAYLVQESDGSFAFSKKKTPLFITPDLQADGTVLIDVTLVSKNSERKGGFSLEPLLQKNTLQSAPCVKALEGIKLWGKDIFLEKFGGNEYEKWRHKFKIYLCKTVYFLEEGDFLTWQEGVWKKVSFEEASPQEPLAQVVFISEKGVKLRVWDKEGFNSFDVEAFLETKSPAKLNISGLIGDPKMISADRVSCILGKRRVVLSPGDWWFRSARGWKIIRTALEVDLYVQSSLLGELLMIDEIAEDNGQFVLRGVFFDRTRAQMEPVNIPVVGKKEVRVKRK